MESSKNSKTQVRSQPLGDTDSSQAQLKAQLAQLQLQLAETQKENKFLRENYEGLVQENFEHMVSLQRKDAEAQEVHNQLNKEVKFMSTDELLRLVSQLKLDLKEAENRSTQFGNLFKKGEIKIRHLSSEHETVTQTLKQKIQCLETENKMLTEKVSVQDNHKSENHKLLARLLKLEQLSDNQDSQIVAMESRIQQLSSDKDFIIVSLQSELDEIRGQLERELADKDAQVSELNSELESTKTQLSEFFTLCEDSICHVEDLKVQLEIALQEKQSLETTTGFASKIVSLEWEMSDQMSDSTSYSSARDQWEESIDSTDFADQIADLKGQNKTLAKRLKRSRKAMSEMNAHLLQNSAEIESLQSQLRFSRESYASQTGTVLSLQNQVNKQQAEIQSLCQQLKSSQKCFDKYQDSVKKLESDFTEAKKQISSLETELDSLKTNQEKMHNSETSLQEKVQEVERVIKEKTDRLEAQLTEVVGVLIRSNPYLFQVGTTQHSVCQGASPTLVVTTSRE